MDNKSNGELSKYILKNSRNKDKNLRYDFMPSLLEIIERPSHIAGRVIIMAIASLLLFLLLWAYFSKMDVVVMGNGNVVTEADTSIVTSQVSGVIHKVYAKEGDKVKAGDILLELDTSDIDLEIQHLERELGFLSVKEEIINKYLMDNNAQVLATDYDEQYQSIVNKFIYANDMYKLQLSQTESHAETVSGQYQSNLNQQLLVIEEQIREYNDEIEIQKRLRDKMTIKSATSGCILSSEASYEGQFVANSQELFVIIPDESKYIFEGYVSDKDIADVSVGDVVQIKLQAYSFSDYGAIEGSILSISPSTISEDNHNYYVVYVEIEEVDTIELKSGLSGTMEINVGERSVLKYFLEPIVGNLDKSLKEQ